MIGIGHILKKAGRKRATSSFRHSFVVCATYSERSNRVQSAIHSTGVASYPFIV